MSTSIRQVIGETLKGWKGEYFQTGDSGIQKYIVTYISDDVDTVVDFLPGHRFVTTRLLNKNGKVSKRSKSFWVTDDGSVVPVNNKAWER